MRRADRLLQIIQILRRHRRPVTANVIADELEVSVRTVYRDIAALQADRVPMRGEAGIGYVLDDGFDLPPLMFDANEIEAVILGLRFVERRGDAGLARAARDVVAKVGAVLPARLKPLLFEASLIVPPQERTVVDRVEVGEIREAIRLERKLRMAYRDENGADTERTIWPLALAYFEMVRVVVGWCELRKAFRHFRTDRIATMDILEARYPGRRAALLKQWQSEMREMRCAANPEMELMA
jgi:predicted DNA-binding transcriptional regulator YafY